ncbi:hypothetical protein M153_19200011303, partial [Pseudoloma neurophilia]
LKKEIAEMKNLFIPDYEKPFVLRTDASNTSLGAVLYQIGEDGEHQPIELASKKLTLTETRYGKSEKEMLLSIWD